MNAIETNGKGFSRDDIEDAAQAELDAKLEAFKKRRFLPVLQNIRQALPLCESPIESRLMIALRLHDWGGEDDGDETVFLWGVHFGPTDEERFDELQPRWPQIWIIPQLKHSGYRIDFGIVTSDNADGFIRLAVECDGHDFHERTKEQAARDKARDRALLVAGFHVVRFAGSEIWRDADACARSIREVIDAKRNDAVRLWSDRYWASKTEVSQ